MLGSRAAAALLVFAVATTAKQRAIARLGSVEDESERQSLPGAVARVAALAADMPLKLEIPMSWMVEVARQFPDCRQTLDAEHLRRLGELAARAGLDDLTYAISTAGLNEARPPLPDLAAAGESRDQIVGATHRLRQSGGGVGP
jgi:hypothetical protein